MSIVLEAKVGVVCFFVNNYFCSSKKSTLLLINTLILNANIKICNKYIYIDFEITNDLQLILEVM